MTTRCDQYSVFPSRAKLQRAIVSISNIVLTYLTSQHSNTVLILLKLTKEGGGGKTSLTSLVVVFSPTYCKCVSRVTLSV
jgi:hypothetical protein